MSQEAKNVDQRPVESLADLEVPAEDANDINAGSKGTTFEIKDFSFGVENPTTIG